MTHKTKIELGEDKNMGFDKNLAVARKTKNYTQEDLAEKLNVTRQTIYAWEAGISTPTVSMLKQISSILEMKLDDLVSGFSIDEFPIKMPRYKLTYLGESKDTIVSNELPNWFIDVTKENDEVKWAMYESDGRKDFSYSLRNIGQTIIHQEKGVRVEVCEYSPQGLKMQNQKSYLIGQVLNKKVRFLAKIDLEEDIQTIKTYKDPDFIRNWGIGKNNIGQSIELTNLKKYELECLGKKHLVYESINKEKDLITYSYVDKNGQTLLWRRFDRKITGKESVTIENIRYGFYYECITDRILVK